MNEPITVTATVAAWLHGGYGSMPHDLIAAIEKGDSVRAVNMVALWGSPDNDSFGEYARVGEADVTLRLLPRDEQMRLAVQALNEKLNDLRARYMQAQQQILDQISSLQALTNEVEA